MNSPLTMMKRGTRRKRFSLVVILLLSCMYSIQGQEVEVLLNQPEPLRANAGQNVTIVFKQGCRLGGNPTAVNGYGNYTYLWEPLVGLTNPTDPNPMVFPNKTTTYQVTITDGSNCVARDEVTVTVQSTGIDDPLNPVTLNLYPNPTSGMLTLRTTGLSGDVSWHVLNTLGQLLLHKQIQVEFEYQEEIDLHHLKPGLYFFRIISGQATRVKPFYIE